MSLDPLPQLRAAAGGYRAAATAAGLTWVRQPDAVAVEPPSAVYRIFDVDRLPEQLTWFQSQGWQSVPLLPGGGVTLPWPTDPVEALDHLSFSIATPFAWRHQLPLFHFGFLVFTFVLDRDHEGEIWRYEISPDAWASARAADSLAALFRQWTGGIDAGVVRYDDLDQWLHVDGGERDPLEVLRATPGVDPYAFPVSTEADARIRDRQRLCGVDLDRIQDGPGEQVRLAQAIAATRAALDRPERPS